VPPGNFNLTATADVNGQQVIQSMVVANVPFNFAGSLTEFALGPAELIAVAVHWGDHTAASGTMQVTKGTVIYSNAKAPATEVMVVTPDSSGLVVVNGQTFTVPPNDARMGYIFF
jgi:hypothetical protein